MGELSSQVSYKPVHKNPMDKNRDPTNTVYLYIFGVGLVAWFIMNCIYLFKENAVGSLMLNGKFTNTVFYLYSPIFTLPDIFHHCGAGLIVWITLIGISIFLVLLKILHRLPPKFGTVVGLISLVLTVAYLICSLCYSVYFLVAKPDPIALDIRFQSFVAQDIIRLIIAIIFLTTGITAARTVRVAGLADIIKKTSDAIFFFPTLFLFSAAITFLILLVIAFTVAALYKIDHGLVGVLSLHGGLFLISVFYYFGMLVIGQCVSTWYWSENKKELSGALIFKSIGLVARNHMGTVAFSSTFIMPIILSLYLQIKKKFPSPPKSTFTSFVVKFYLIFFITEHALMVTASHGLGIRSAMKKIYSLFTRSCVIFMAFSCVFDAILRLFLVISMLITMAVAMAIFQETLLSKENIFYTAPMYYFLGFYLFITTYLTAHTAANMVLVNTTEEIEEKEEREINQIESV